MTESQKAAQRKYREKLKQDPARLEARRAEWREYMRGYREREKWQEYIKAYRERPGEKERQRERVRQHEAIADVREAKLAQQRKRYADDAEYREKRKAAARRCRARAKATADE